VSLFVLTADPEFDSYKKEWKVEALPVVVEWGLITLSIDDPDTSTEYTETWTGGGHRGDDMIEPRWRRMGAEHTTTLWFPDTPRETGTEYADGEVPPTLAEDDRVYAAKVGEHLCVVGGVSGSRLLLVGLDDDLDWDDSTGVSGVVWAGTPEVVTTRTLEGIVAIPKITTSGTFLAGSFVLVERKDGRWKVTGAPCS
jgi:hypothetical protein